MFGRDEDVQGRLTEALGFRIWFETCGARLVVTRVLRIRADV